MHGLVEVVKEFGLVPIPQILSAPGYKAIYNDELKALVNDPCSPNWTGENSTSATSR